MLPTMANFPPLEDPAGIAYTETHNMEWRGREGREGGKEGDGGREGGEGMVLIEGEILMNHREEVNSRHRFLLGMALSWGRGKGLWGHG